MNYFACILLLSFLWLCGLIIFPGRSRRRLPPGPRPLPVIGNILQLGPKPHRALADLAKLYGPVMSLKLGAVTTVVVSSADAAREVLQKNDEALSSRPVPDTVRAADHSRYSLAWQPASAKWKSLRRVCSTHIFAPQKLDSTRPLRQRKVDELLHYLDQCSVQGRPVWIGQVVFTTILNIVSNTLVSMDMAHYDESSSQEFKEIIEGLMKEAGVPNISDFFPALRFLDLQGGRKRMNVHFSRLFQLFDRIILEKSRTRASSAGSSWSKDALDSLLDLKDAGELTRNEIHSLLLDLIAGGVETTQSTVEWSMAELLKNPTKMANACAELAQVLERGVAMQESDISKLPYLQAVIKETLRLHSSFLLPHKAETEVELCGFKLPKDTRILVNLFAMGQEESVWSNPSRFEPERFLKREIDFKGKQFEYIPFGAGRRMCPGLSMAWRIIPLMLGSLIHCFQWKLMDGETPETLDMEEKFGLSIPKAKPLVAIPIKSQHII